MEEGGQKISSRYEGKGKMKILKFHYIHNFINIHDNL